MKKNYFIVLLAFAFLLSFSACKPKESAYRSVYEKAKSAQQEKEQQKEKDRIFASVEGNQPDSPYFYSSASSSSSVATTPAYTFQRERVTAINGSGIKQYSVVVGSFVSKTNADSLKDRMRARGYNTFLAKNEKGMYRVVAASFDNKAEAVQLRDRIKERYESEFGDSWLLEKID
jgi:cell division septation protein DedD